MTQTKPLVTFLLFAYKQEEFIAEAVKGALAQDYSNLEIVISDDCSPDKTYDIIEETIAGYKGNHKIILNRNPINRGLVPHLNYLFREYTKAEYIVLAAGDDISLPHRVSTTVNYFQQYPQGYGITFPLQLIDEKGNIIKKESNAKDCIWTLNREYLLSPSFMVGGGSLAVRKEVVSYFGELDEQTPTEDSTLRLRSLLLGQLVEGTDICMQYRIHGNNISAVDRIYDLKTHLIALQYIGDIQKAFRKKLISASRRDVLLLKTDYFIRQRTYSEKMTINRKNPLKRYFYAFPREISSLLYRSKLTKAIDKI